MFRLGHGYSKGELMSELVKKVGVKKEKGYLYFVDSDGDISRAKMVRRGSIVPVDPPEKVISGVGVKREPNWNYFVDKEGHISRSPSRRRRIDKMEKEK